MRRFLILALLFFGACSSHFVVPVYPSKLQPQQQLELANWLAANGQSPVEYTVGLFSNHDVVFLGEFHRVKHDVLLVQSLIEPLYAAGVRVLATEFARREDQPLIDTLLAGTEYDKTLAREITFRSGPYWGYQEYVDIYRVVWEMNQRLPEGASHFRILAMKDSPNWSLVKTQEDRRNHDILVEVWRGSGENLWANVILDAVDSGEKVVVHCGIHHAFTKYRQPIVSAGEFKGFDSELRCGNHVYEALGERAVTVFLHAPWNTEEGYESPQRHPADGIIDALMESIGPHPLGFDLRGGPLGELRIKKAIYKHGYEDFKLADFCDGWIYTKPLWQSDGVTTIADWTHAGNIDRARSQSPNLASRRSPIRRFQRSMVSAADIRERWKHLR